MPKQCHGQAAQEPYETLIFVDVDGVLNVGVSDSRGDQLDFGQANVAKAIKAYSYGCRRGSAAERLALTYRRQLGHGEGSTYAKFLSCPRLGVSDVLVRRLARIIHSAGENRTVVLSSTWRKPQHKSRVRRLEDAISGHLGEHFAFDARTELGQDGTPEDRLVSIGDFLQEHCAGRSPSAPRLRVVVLDDLHGSPLSGWACEYTPVESARDVESYLKRRIQSAIAAEENKPGMRYELASVKFVHTYDQFQTAGGDLLQVGSGLVMQHFVEALSFLGSKYMAHKDVDVCERGEECDAGPMVLKLPSTMGLPVCSPLLQLLGSCRVFACL